MSDAPSVEEIESAVRNGADWLSSHQMGSGELDGCGSDLAGYYKAPLLFAVSGRSPEGIRCLEFIRARFLEADGELRSGPRKTNLARMERNLANYMNGWVAIGAWLLGSLELADLVAGRLVSQQSEFHGGIRTGPDEWAGYERYDLATAASCGRAFLHVGHRDAALRAGRFLVEALQHQSNPEVGLDLSFDAEWHTLESQDASERTYYRFDLALRGEKVWFPAFSSGFLSELYEVSGDPAHLNAAIGYFDYIAATPEFGDGTLANGKSAWASGRLAHLTGQDRFSKAFHTIVPNVLRRQSADGHFRSSADAQAEPQGLRQPTPSTPRECERTAEFTMWASWFLRLRTAERAREDRGA